MGGSPFSQQLAAMPASHPTTDPCLLQATQLARLIAKREVSSREVVQAFLNSIEEHNPLLRAIVQPCYEQALQEADAADRQTAELASEGRLGPLHGVPVTIKDCFAVAGLETTLGIHGYSKGRDSSDSPLVARLRNAGAIVLGKTNVSQGMLLHECDNPLFGRTLLPGNPDRSPGGSSGGEAAAVAARLSPLGLGSDLGGSTRQPAHSCGVCGFKPTGGRLTVVGSQRALRGMRSLALQPGPIAQSVADMDLAMRVMLDDRGVAKQLDESPEPWRNYREVDVSSLRIAFWTDNGIMRSAYGLAGAVERAAQVLRAEGADVRQVPPPDHREMMRLYLGLISADGLRSLARLLRGVRVNPQLRRQVAMGRIPRWVRPPGAGVLRLLGQSQLADLLHWSGPRSADAYWQATADADDYKKFFWRKLSDAFGGGPVHAVLTPPHATPALRHGTALHLLLGGSYCFLANLLDAPAGVLPAGSISDEDQQQELSQRRDWWELEQHYAKQNATGSAGLPVGVQVMSPPWRDELVFAVMAALEGRSELRPAAGAP
ncbi:MAG: hypothetical protein KDA37_03520 [Planctomycetales bacterium]|nr:hypothetical protein [Planctomycetales bacterium]